MNEEFEKSNELKENEAIEENNEKNEECKENEEDNENKECKGINQNKENNKCNERKESESSKEDTEVVLPEITVTKKENGTVYTTVIEVEETDPAELEKASQPKDKYDIKTYSNNDMGNADRFLDYYGEDVCYCAETEQWYHFNGEKWAAVTPPYMEHLIWTALQHSYIHDGKFYKEFDAGLEGIQDHFKQQLKKSGNMSTIRNCLAAAATKVLISPDKLDKDPYWFHVKNGSFNVKTLQMRRYHQKDQYNTKCANVNFPFDLEPDSFHSLEELCPNWAKFVRQCCLGDEALVRYLKKAAGYSILCGDIWEQSVFCLFGEGRNGKSLFINTLAEIAGDYATKIDSSLLCRNRFGERDTEALKEIDRIRGCRFVYANEFSRSSQLNEMFIKNLTDEGGINGRPMYDKGIVYKPTYKLWFSTNHLPNLSELDEGIRRRLIIIPFNLQLAPHEVDKTLPETFRKEAEGILYWLFSGCFGYFMEGLEQPEVIRRATRRYFDEQNRFLVFLEEHYVIDAEGKVGAQALYDHYKRWCEANGEKAAANNQFGQEMARLKIEKIHCSDGNYYALRKISERL